jgi:hypothetical protein
VNGRRSPTRRRLLAIGSTVLTMAGLAVVAAAQPAQADGPGAGAPWVVSLGDSAISGEAGRWAGNSNGDPSRIDALGPTAYFDNATNTAEQIPGCHRSKSAEIYIGGGVNGLNLACSGAKAQTSPFSSGSDFKPGLDFYNDGAGHQGQALMLQQFASTHNVNAVAVLIGANNYHFADIVQACVTDWLLSPSFLKNLCQDDSNIASNFTPANVTAQTAAIKTGLLNVRQAMANAGYADSAYSIVVETYWDPIPRGTQFRYKETGFTRQTVGGCGVWNSDANWANDSAFATINGSVRNAAAQAGLSNVKVLDISQLTTGHRLCENTVGLLEERGVSTWRQAGASDSAEWINQIRTVTTLVGPFQLQEASHANYWGQLAMRNCFRQVYNGGVVRGGSCSAAAGGGLNASGEPNVSLN